MKFVKEIFFPLFSIFLFSCSNVKREELLGEYEVVDSFSDVYKTCSMKINADYSFKIETCSENIELYGLWKFDSKEQRLYVVDGSDVGSTFEVDEVNDNIRIFWSFEDGEVVFQKNRD